MIPALARRHGWSLLGVASVVLTFVGMMGIGDAPDPHDLPTAMASHFTAASSTILNAAPLGYLGAIGIGAFTLTLAHRLRNDERTSRAPLVALAGGLIAGYLVVLQLIYTSLAYQVAERSADATHALFVPTILAVPPVGALAAILLAAAAWAGHQTGSMPRWWLVATAAGAALASVALVSYRHGGSSPPTCNSRRS